VILSSSRGAAVPLVLQRQLVGIGQIYFQATPVFGAVLLFCLYLSGPILAAGAVLGVSVASLVAWALVYAKADRDKGLFSFNGALSGIGLCACYEAGWPLCVAIVLAGVLTAIFSRCAQLCKLPVLTSGFVLVMWLAIVMAPVPGLTPRSYAGCRLADETLLFCAWAQASFVPSAWLGCLLLASTAWLSRRASLWVLGAGIAVWAVASTGIGIRGQVADIAMNCMLTALGLSVYRFPHGLRVAGIVLGGLLAWIMGQLGMPCLTLPFILATWSVFMVRVTIR
jgi:urea transporter